MHLRVPGASGDLHGSARPNTFGQSRFLRDINWVQQEL